MRHYHFLLLIGLAWCLFSSTAQAYSIDHVHTRVWIAPTGEVLVNEVFTYTFDGNPETIDRSFLSMEDVEQFEAFHIPIGETTPGFIRQTELVPLPVEKNGSDWSITLPSLPSFEEQTFVYVYQLQEVVETYADYSQLTISLYSKDYNEKLSDVTLDVVLPFEISPQRVHGFFDDRYGRIQEKTPLVWSFHTPHSPSMSTTDIRLLFPSEGMTQPVTPSPHSFAEAVEKEAQQISQGQTFWGYQQQMIPPLWVLSALLFLLAALFLVLRFLKERQREARPLDVMEVSPLSVAYIDPPERPSHLLLGGLYELVEQQQLRVTYDNGLLFHKTVTTKLTPAQHYLIDLLFQDENSLIWNQAAARFPSMKRGSVQKWRRLVEQEKRQEFKFTRWPRLVVHVLNALTILVVFLLHYLDRGDVTITYFMTGVALALFVMTMKSHFYRWGVSLSIFLLLAIFLLEDPDVMKASAASVIALLLIQILLPQMTYSEIAWQARKNVQTFRQTLIYDSNFALTKDQVERWLIRAYLLQTRKNPLYLPKVTGSVESHEAPLYHHFALQNRIKTWK